MCSLGGLEVVSGRLANLCERGRWWIDIKAQSNWIITSVVYVDKKKLVLGLGWRLSFLLRRMRCSPGDPLCAISGVETESVPGVASSSATSFRHRSERKVWY